MTLAELNDLILGAGFYSIRVESLDDRPHRSLSFVGTVDEYLCAAKAMGVNAILLSTTTVEEEHFYFRDEPEDTTTDKQESLVDLCKILPRLLSYRQRVGEHGIFELSAISNSITLSYSIAEEWMLALVELLSEARERAEERKMLSRAEIKAKEEARTASILKKLRALVSDQDFARLPTQIAMRAYAVEKFPELQDVNESDLKREIQELRAKIQAKVSLRSS